MADLLTSHQLECDDCGDEMPIGQRRIKCKHCGKYCCKWCFYHAHGLVGHYVPSRKVNG